MEQTSEATKSGSAFNGVKRDLKACGGQIQECARHTERTVEVRSLELEKTREELINKAMEAGRARISSLILHDVGNAVTPVRIQMETMKEADLPQLAEYIERGFLDLKEHAGDIQRYIHEDPKGMEVFGFMGRAIEGLKESARARDEALNRLERTLTCISELLTLQQRYAGKANGPKELVDLNLLVLDAVRMQARALEKRDITIRKDLMTGLPKIVIDKSRLMQVLLDLLTNSCEAADEPAGRGKAKEIALRSYHEGEYACVEIKDNGAGMKPERTRRLCEFGQSHKGFSGVGLHWCKMFLEANGGTLDVDSEGTGKGTTALIRLRAG